jgi:hypothetical protein
VILALDTGPACGSEPGGGSVLVLLFGVAWTERGGVWYFVDF